MCIQTFVQYQQVIRQARHFTVRVDGKSEELFTQRRFSREPNPGDGAFVSYSDHRFEFDRIDFALGVRTFSEKQGY